MSANFSHSVRLTQSALSWLTAKLEKWPAIEVVATPVEVKDEYTDEISVQFDTRVSLNAPVIPGHTLLARIEHLGEGNIVYRCGGTERPEYRTCAPKCDHCGTIRRRHDTFIIREEATGAEKQIGRNCLTEYVRDPAAAEYLLNWADCVDRILGSCSDAEEMGGSGRAPETYTVPYILSWALAYAGKWVSASQARETGGQSSASVILGFVYDLRSHKAGDQWWHTREGQNVRAMADRAEALRADQESAVYQTIAWIKTLAAKPEAELTDYEHNLTVIVRLGYATVKQWSFVCSAFRAWLRAQHIARGEEEKREREAQGPTGQHVGEVGQRIGFKKANCIESKSIGFSEDYGERCLVKFITAEGAELVWFTGVNDFEAGKEYDITATVKKHEEYRGARNTLVSRVALGVKEPKAKKGKKVKA